MKKFVFVVVLAVLTVFSAFPQESSSSEDRKVKTVDVDRNRVKLGLLAGYPISGVTLGYRVSNWLEPNIVVGFGLLSNQFSLGVNAQIALLRFPVEGDLLLSLGPQVNFAIGSSYFRMDILSNLRLEYSFKNVPLNIFLEGGVGVSLFKPTPVGFRGSGGFGIRYVF